jgi:CheY-like chemotaxis protein
LAGGLAHDFNNILTVVIGNLSALQDARPADPACDEFVEPAMEAARRGAELIRGLLSFSRQQPLAAQRVDVAEQIRSAARLVRRSLPESLQLEVVTVLGQPLWAWTDATRLQNSLLNLILNARDATAGLAAPATIRVQASRTEQAASDRQRLPLASGSYVRIDVADNGIGMDAETQARVFEPFFTTKRPGLGTGLGLAMVHDFVRQSGGAVDVLSQLGHGATISLWLPWDHGQASSAAANPSQHPMTHRDRGVALLVEDEAAVRRVVRRLLLELGYAVVEAEDGLEAQTMLAGMPQVALLLTDIVMPGGVDGRVLARQARDQDQAQSVALMSGYAPGELDCGGIPMIAKPFTRDALARFLESLPP